MGTQYSPRRNDSDDDYTWLLIAVFTFLVIVVPCVVCVKRH